MAAGWDVQPAQRASFERGDGLGGGVALVKDANTELRRVARVVEWLEQLRDRRIEERDTGAWPYPPDPQAARFPCGRSHVCLSCSPRPDVPGNGCVNCRQTRFDQTPCLDCAQEVRVGGTSEGGN